MARIAPSFAAFIFSNWQKEQQQKVCMLSNFHLIVLCYLLLWLKNLRIKAARENESKQVAHPAIGEGFLTLQIGFGIIKCESDIFWSIVWISDPYLWKRFQSKCVQS